MNEPILESTPRQLHLSVEISLRYHNRRHAYFETLHKVVMAIGIFGSTAALAEIKTRFFTNLPNGEIVVLLGVATVAILNVCDLVIGFGPMARLHSSLHQKFLELAVEMDKMPSPDEKQIENWRSLKLLIERDEPAPFHVVYIMCKNEVLRSTGRKGDIKYVSIIPWPRRLFAHVFKQQNFIGSTPIEAS